MTAAHRVYQNDDVFRVLARHCDKPSLVHLMAIEQQGTIFDTCVKELYREVDYEVIKPMVRDTPRRSQYLDAVVHVRSDPPGRKKRLLPFPTQCIDITDMDDNAEPCSPTAVSFLRLKCPNLGIVTRHKTGCTGQRFTIILPKGKRIGTVRLHEQINICPPTPDHQVMDPFIQIPTIWQGWTISHTVGLWMNCRGDPVHQPNGDIKALLQNPDRLDGRISQIHTGWLSFTLSELGAIAASRSPDKKAISRFNSTVEPFTFNQLELFFKVAGKSLYQLHLHTRPEPSLIDYLSLSAIVEMVRTRSPNLVDLRLPMNFMDGSDHFTDHYIELPCKSLVSGPGTVRTLCILAYDLGSLSGGNHNNLHRICFWNFARNLACLLAPDFELSFTLGPTDVPTDTTEGLNQVGLPFVSWYMWHEKFKAAIKFFQRLGPNLEPHFEYLSMANLGVYSVENLEDLMYKTNGQPIEVEPSTSWSYGKKRTWSNYYYGDDPDYQEDADREDQEHEAYLEAMEKKEKEDNAEEKSRLAAHEKHSDALDKPDQKVPDADAPLSVKF